MATVLGKGKTVSADKFDSLVEDHLARARKRIRTLDALVALLGWLAGSLAFGLLMLILDAWVGLPLLVRQLALGVYGLGSLVYLAFALVMPLFQRLNPYYAAKQIEQTVPNSKNSLVNWLDLHEQKLPTAFRGAVGQRAAKDLAQADMEKAISGRRAAFAGGATALFAVGLLFAVFVIRLDNVFGEDGFLYRLLFPFGKTALPSSTRLVLTQPRDGDITVSVGQPVDFVVRVEGKVPEASKPESIRLLFRYEAKLEGQPDDGAYQEAFLEPDRSDKEGRRWVTFVPSFRVQNGFWYKVVVGVSGLCDYYETPEYHVSVRSGPMVEKFEASYTYRRYTGFPPDANTSPNLRAIRGSEVTLIARTNRVVLRPDGRVDASMALDLPSGKSEIAAAPVPDDPKAIRFHLVLNETGKYKLWFRSVDGEQNVEPTPYNITAIQDEKPTISLHQPGRDVTLAANETLRLAGLAADDLGVTNAVLRMKIKGGAELPSKRYRDGMSFQLVDGSYPRNFEYKDFVVLPELKDSDDKPVALKPGMEIEYWLEGRDACDWPLNPMGTRAALQGIGLTPLPVSPANAMMTRLAAVAALEADAFNVSAHVGESTHYTVFIREPIDPMAAQDQAKQAQNDQQQHDNQQDQALNQENQQRKDQGQGQPRPDGQRQPGDDKEPSKPEATKPPDMNGGQGDPNKDNQANKDNTDPDKQEREDRKLKEEAERLEQEKKKQDQKPGESKANDPSDKPKGEAKERQPQQGEPKNDPKNDQGEKGQNKESKGQNQGEQKPDGKGKDEGQKQGQPKEGDPGDAKDGGQQGKPEDRSESKGGGEGQKQESTAKGGGQPQQGGPGQPGDPKPGEEGEGKGASAQDLKDQKPGGSKGTNGKLRHEPGECKQCQNPGNDNGPTGDPKDEPKTLSRAENKVGGQQNQNQNQQQGSSKGEGQKNQGGEHGKGEAKFDRQQTADKGSGKPESKNGDGSGMGEDEKATKDDVEKLKRKAKSQDTKERDDANKKLDNIGEKAKDEQVRDAAKQAKQEAQEENRREQEGKPGDAKAGGQQDPNGQRQDGMQGMEEKVAGAAKGGDGKEEKQAGDSKGDQPGVPGKDKGVSKGQGEKQGGDVVRGSGNTSQEPGPTKPGGGTGGQGDRPPDAPPGEPKPAPKFEADKAAHKQAADLQLKNIKELIDEIKKNPQNQEKILDALKMSPERFKELENQVKEKLPPAQDGIKLGQTGVERIEPGKGNGIDVQGGGQGKVPPGYEDAYKKLTQELAKPKP